jgi:hypothetical protein
VITLARKKARELGASFAAHIQKQIDKHNRKVDRDRAEMDKIRRELGLPAGAPIPLSALMRKR